jgi:hypothetical protein
MTALDANLFAHFGNEEVVQPLVAELKELPAICRRELIKYFYRQHVIR